MCTVVTCVHIHAIWEIQSFVHWAPVYKRLSEGKQNVNVYFFYFFYETIFTTEV